MVGEAAFLPVKVAEVKHLQPKYDSSSTLGRHARYWGSEEIKARNWLVKRKPL